MPMLSPSLMSNLKELMHTIPQVGKVEWIGIRSKKKVSIEIMNEVAITEEEGIIGDHYSGQSKKRQVTLIQSEHLDAVASILKKEAIDPSLTRRNIVISGVNLLAFKELQFRVGKEVILEMTGLCHPCSRMEENLGEGGYNAMRGHGGITTKVVKGGTILLGDRVELVSR